MDQEVIVVGYQEYHFVKSLVVGEIEFLEIDLNLSLFEGLIFTSKNAIRALVENAKKNPSLEVWKKIPSYVIGEGSAKELRENGGNLAFVASDFYGDVFALELLQKVSSQSLLYLRAKEIVSHLDERLKIQGVNLVSKVIYQNKKKLCPQSDKPNPNSILLFTSPSAYRFFVEQFEWDKSYLAVALGKSTFASFSSKIKAIISPQQGIQKSVQYLKTTKSFSFS